MKPVDDVEILLLQQAQQETLFDRCIVQTLAEGQDTFGASTKSYADGEEIPCGFKPAGGNELWTKIMTSSSIDATLRLASGTVIAVTNRIKMTQCLGFPNAVGMIYEVTQEPQQGRTGIQVQLQKVTV